MLNVYKTCVLIIFDCVVIIITCVICLLCSNWLLLSIYVRECSGCFL